MSNAITTKKQVLLCGTQYGQTYLPAIFQENEFELAAILAQGSDRSLRLAEQYGVELVTQLSQLNQAIDVACVAINETIATPLALELMEMGIDILIEHPISANNMAQLAEQAVNTGRKCHINSHFPELPPISDLITLCRKLNSINPPRLIQVQCNSRTLFSTLDILMRCFGLFEHKDLNIHTIGQYRNCTLSLNGIATVVTYQHWRYANDNSADSALGHQITITYPQGVLSLSGTFGPCMWFPLLVPGVPAGLPVSQTRLKDLYNTVDIASVIQWRKRANQKALRELSAEHDCLEHHQRSYSQYLCQLWTSLFERLGFKIIAPTECKEKKLYTPEDIINT